MNKIGGKIKTLVEEAAKRKGLQKKEIADAAGLTGPQLSTLCHPETDNTTLKTIDRLCSACDVSMWKFVAYMETGIPMTAWTFFESIMSLEGQDRTFVLKSIQNAVEYIESQKEKPLTGRENKKKV